MFSPMSPDSQAIWDVLEAEAAERQLFLQRQTVFWRPWEQGVMFTSPLTEEEQEFWDGLGSISWIPAPGTGPLKRNHDQIGGDLEEPLVWAEGHPEEEGSKWRGKLRETAIRVTLRHRLHEVEDLLEVAPSVDAAIATIVDPLLSAAGDNDLVALSIEHEDLEEGIRMSFIAKRSFNSQCFLDAIYRWVQSQSSAFLMDGQLVLRVAVLKIVTGTGFKAVERAGAYFDPKRSIVKIRNNGSSCGWLAITLAIIMCETPKIRSVNRKRWYHLTKKDSESLKEETLRYLYPFDTAIPLSSVHFGKVQDFLRGYQLIVLQRPGLGSEILCPVAPLFIGPETNKKIIIEHHDNHFNVIRSLTGYYSANDGFCTKCWKKINRRYHDCPSECSLCGSFPPCLSEGESMECVKCHLLFHGKNCYENHPCSQKKMKCSECEVTYHVLRGHECGVYSCHHCSESYTTVPHYCFIDKLDMERLHKADEKNKVIIAFDIEARLAETSLNRFEHVANLLISHTVCDICAPGLEDKNGDCSECGRMDHEFFGDDCVARFIDYVMEELSPSVSKGSRIHVFSHNAKGYDHRFIMNELFTRDYLHVEPILQGSKVLKIDCGNVRFQDSMSLLPMPLSAIPGALGMEGKGLKKGFFPHNFNKEENYAITEGPWPSRDYYDLGSMKKKARKEFDEWYESVKHKKFNFMEEIFSYCRMDVMVLLFGVRKLRDLFTQVTGIDPITRSFTLAGIAFEYFRASELPAKTIGITPIDGYLEQRKSSAVGNAWLDMVEKTWNIKLIREQPIGPYFVDGVHDKNVYEFLGCFFHGCPYCHHPEKEIKGTIASELDKKVTEKVAYLKRRGFNVFLMRECDESLKNNVYFKARVAYWHKIKNLDLSGPRDALFGGRTENIRLAHACEAGSSIKYVDYVSLYPYVLKNRNYPTGHPVLITEDILYEPGKYFGFAHVKVLPPKNLLMPVLPTSMNGKLLFVLCRTCGEKQQQSSCYHSQEERCITGLFVTPELDLAISKGYQVLEVDFVQDYKTSSDSLFSGYVDKWLKIKLEKSGLPKGVETPEIIREFIRETHEREGILLDEGSIEKNPGLRLISKLMLNSLWGKLAQRGNMWQTKLISSYQDMVAIVGNEGLDVLAPILLPGESSVLVNWRYKDERDARQNKTSPAIAAFVTAYGRCLLYDLIDRLETVRSGRCLYMDTDSVFFEHRPGDPEIKTGVQLGELTDEVEGMEIVAGVFAGPKSYAYRVREKSGNEFSVMKVKGITLTSEADELLTMESVSNLVTKFAMAGSSDVMFIPQRQFFANKRTQVMMSRHFLKKFQVTTTKRRVTGLLTVPYGWQDEEQSEEL